MSKKKIFISGPYSNGDQIVNTRHAIDAWHLLWKEGYAPFCPHIHAFAHMISPLPYGEWMQYCFEYIKVCDGIYRLPGISKGADAETAFALSNKIPVFKSIDDINRYFQDFQGLSFKRTYT